MRKRVMIPVMVVIIVLGIAGTSAGEICLRMELTGETNIFAFQNLGNGIYSLHGYYLSLPTLGLNWVGTILATGGTAYITTTGGYPGGDANYAYTITYTINLLTNSGTGNTQVFHSSAGVVGAFYNSGLDATLLRGCSPLDAETTLSPGAKPFLP